MKSGLVHWVLPETWEKFSEHIANQSAHGFIRIRELNVTLNTAEIEGVYTMSQYEDLEKVRQGMWQCQYRNWHNKGKRECECKKDFYRKQEEIRRKKEEDEANKPQTPEERERSIAALTLMNEEWALEGNPIGRSMFQIGNRTGRVIRKATIEQWEKKNGCKANLAGLSVEKDSEDITNNEDQHDNA